MISRHWCTFIFYYGSASKYIPGGPRYPRTLYHGIILLAIVKLIKKGLISSKNLQIHAPLLWYLSTTNS